MNEETADETFVNQDVGHHLHCTVLKVAIAKPSTEGNHFVSIATPRVILSSVDLVDALLVYVVAVAGSIPYKS